MRITTKPKRVPLKGIALAVSLIWLLGAAASGAGSSASDPSNPSDPPEEQSAVARTQKVAALLSSAQGPAAESAPRIAKANGGYVRHLGFPRGRGIEAPGADPQNPRDVTEKFLSQWRDAFVNPSAKVNFVVGRANTHRGRSYVRVQQKYGGLKIFDADLNIQVGADGRVNSLLCNVMRDTGALDRGELSTSPTLTAEAAQQTARQAVVQLFSDTTSTATLPASAVTLQDLTASPPELLLFHPPVVGRKGPTRLVWNTVVGHSGGPLVREQVLVDAQTGEIPLHFTLIENAKYRNIYDSANVGGVGTLERSEGEPATGRIDPVNLGYDFFGDIYDQNASWHGLDSYNNAGHTIDVSVRWYDPYYGDNALWDGVDHIFMGTNLLFDDIAMHEFTHAVTQYLAPLTYSGESGALNESFSDMWGEWFDQEHDYVNHYNYTNHDGGNYDWLCGEDYSGGALRSLKNPPDYSTWYGGAMPDRYKSPNWYTGDTDGGGVHHNSGVGNKLCYLFTDGDTFNGFTISSVAPGAQASARRGAAADLFFAARSGLTSSAGYHDLYSELMDAADALSYSDEQELNLKKACQSVNIRSHENVGLTFRDTNGDKVALLQDSGELVLKTSYIMESSTVTPTGYGLTIRDDSGTVVAFQDVNTGENGGYLTIKGTLTENWIPSAAGALLVVRYEGVPVVALDSSGNLTLWREADIREENVEEGDW